MKDAGQGAGRGSSELPAAAHPGCPGGGHAALAARLPHLSNEEFLSGALEVYIHMSTSFPALPLLNFSAQNTCSHTPESTCCRFYTPDPSPACRLPNTSRKHEDGVLMSLTHSFTHPFTVQSEGTKPSPAHRTHNPSGKGQKDNQP